MKLICPFCGSASIEFIKDKFDETIAQTNTTVISKSKGISSKIHLKKESKIGYGSTAGLKLKRNNRWICHDCGHSFDQQTKTIIGGYMIGLSKQFLHDYFQLTSLIDMKDLFRELIKKMPRTVAKYIELDPNRAFSPSQFDIGVRISWTRFIVTCDLMKNSDFYVKLEGLVRK